MSESKRFDNVFGDVVRYGQNPTLVNWVRKWIGDKLWTRRYRKAMKRAAKGKEAAGE